MLFFVCSLIPTVLVVCVCALSVDIMTTAHFSSPQQSPHHRSLTPLFVSHLKLNVQSSKVAEENLSERCFCWLVEVEVDNVHIGCCCGLLHRTVADNVYTPVC